MRWGALPVWKRDLTLAALVTAAAEFEILLVTQPWGAPVGWLLTNLLLMPALTLRRVRPMLAALAATAWFAVQPLTEGPLPLAIPFLTLLFLLASIGWHSPLSTGLLGTAAVLAGGLVSALVAGTTVGDIVVNAVLFIGAWAVGHLLRRASDQRVQAELEVDRASRHAVAAERGRIARDLHDSMGHALTLITLQAGVGRERSAEPATCELLGRIEATGREALADMHRLLRLVGEGDTDGVRGMTALPDLVADIRRSGLAVELAVDLPTDVPTTLSTTVYRIVQEGLTNVMRHSSASRATVDIARYAEDAVLVRVADDGHARPASVAGSGRGLPGLCERVQLLGGTLASGTDGSGSGWTLKATIPWRTS